MKACSRILSYLIAAVLCQSIFTKPTFANELSCTTLEVCIEEVESLLREDASGSGQFIPYRVGERFAGFDQAGFDALLDMAAAADEPERQKLLSTLSSPSMEPPGGTSFGFALSPSQRATLKTFWTEAPDFSTALLLGRDSPAQANDFLIGALMSPREEDRILVTQILQYYGFTQENTSVDAKHLDDILYLIETEHLSSLVDALDRINTPEGQEAMWGLLDSSDRWVFQEALEILGKRDYGRLYEALEQQKFADTLLEKTRANMVAQAIAMRRRDSEPSLQNFEYWKAWYDQTNASDVSRIIPTYMLFDLFEKTSKKVSSAEKSLSDSERFRDYTIENPEGRPEYLSVPHLTKQIELDRKTIAKFRPLRDKMEAYFEADETRTLDDYFRIYDAINIQSETDAVRWQIPPFPLVLDTFVQTPKRWAKKFEADLSCEKGWSEIQILKMIVTLNPESERLKTCLISRLKDADDLNRLIRTLALIIEEEGLRSDPEIRSAMSDLPQSSPFTPLQVALNLALSDRPPPEASSDWRHSVMGFRGDIIQKINETKTYCEATNPQSPDYLDPPPDLTNSLEASGYGFGARVMTVKTPSGYLAGHNSGEFGGGLVYHADQNTPGESLHQMNTVAILETDTPGIYWALAGLNHMFPGKGTLFKVDARTDNVSAEIFMTLPNVPNYTYVLSSGDLFLRFHREPSPTYDEDGNVTGEAPVNTAYYNTPVIMTKSGAFIPACGN